MQGPTLHYFTKGNSARSDSCAARVSETGRPVAPPPTLPPHVIAAKIQRSTGGAGRAARNSSRGSSQLHLEAPRILREVAAVLSRRRHAAATTQEVPGDVVGEPLLELSGVGLRSHAEQESSLSHA